MRIKRVICTVLTLVLFVTGFPVFMQEVHAEEYTWTDTDHGIIFTYEDQSDGSVSIKKIESLNPDAAYGSLDLVLPDTIDNKNVSAIDANSVKVSGLYRTVTFNKWIELVPYHWGSFSNVTSITFPSDSVCETIANEAFYGCSNLETVVFADALTTIGNSVFVNCPKLNSVTFGNSLVTIGEQAFQGTAISTLVIPNSVKEIGKEAFYLCTKLTSLTLGSGLLSIGEGAFCSTSISELVLPNSLTTLGKDAFKNIGELTTITWPQGNATFNTIDGFNGDSGLSNDVLLSIPSTVTTIADYAFANCHFTEVTIPQSVEYVGKYAFSRNTLLESIVIRDSNASLTIDEYAFSESIKMTSKSIILPERVSTLKNKSFDFSFSNNSNTFTIYNKNIVINGDPWGNMHWTTIKYPSDLTSETSSTFIEYKTAKEANPGDYPFTFEIFDTNPTFTVSGTIPQEATLTANVNGTSSTPTLTNGSFSFKAPEGSYVSLTISLNNYQDKVLIKKSNEFTADWNIGTVTTSDMVLINSTGILNILTEGVGANDANISIFASNGNLAASGVAQGGQFVSPSLERGTYTVVALAKNPYISAITSISSINELGLSTTEYQKVDAVVKAGETEQLNINVPSVNVTDYSSWVNSSNSFVDIDRSIVTVGMEFYAEVYYKMADGKSADEVRVIIPSGFDVVSVTSDSKKYNVTAVYNSATGIVSIAGLSGNETSSGTIYVGLRSQQAGKFAISASVVSAGVAIPIGSKDFAIDSIMLKLSSELLTSREFGVTVYAQPGKQIKLKPGTGDEIVLGTTNKLGYLSTTAELPVDSQPGISYGVIATVTDDVGTYSDAAYVYLVEKTATIKDFYFVHANHQYYLAKNGINKSGGFYTYVSDGSEASKNWTFVVSFESLTTVSGNVTVSIKMEDGSFRDLVLSPLKSTVQANGKVLTEYAGNISLGTGEYHVFDSSLVPAGFNVRYESEVVPMEESEEYDEYIDSLAKAEYANRLTTAINMIQPAGYTQQQAIDYINSGAYNAIFGKQYYISTNTDPDISAWYNSLSDENKQKVRSIEMFLDDAFCMLADLLDDNKPMYEYESWDEYILDNCIEITEHTLKTNTKTGASLRNLRGTGDEVDVESLIAQGYTISGNVAYKPLGYSNYSYIYLDTKNNTATEYTQKNKNIDLDKWIANGDRLSQGCQEADLELNLISSALLLSEAENATEITKHIGDWAGKPLGWVNTIVSFFDLHNRSKTYAENVAEASKLESDSMTADYKLDQMHKQWLEGKLSAECYYAMMDEHLLFNEASGLAKLRNDMTLNSVYAGTIGTAVGAILFVPTAAGAIGYSSSVASFEIIKDSTAATFTNTLIGLVNYGTDRCIKKITSQYNSDIAYIKAKAEATRVRRIDACNRNDFEVDYWKEAIKDPSGFVYEAVESNRIEGATATLVNVTSGLNFNATDYDQENPLTTDAEGRYAWDVPNGIWRVDVSKAGYTTSSSANLEVPPPRMDVRIPLVTNQAPQVESVNAYKDYVEIIFNQYMKVDGASGIVASIDGVAVSSYSWIDPEESPSSEYYSKIVRINTPAGTKVGDNLQIVVNNAKNYAGSSMSSAYNSNVEVTHKPSTIELNYETSLTIKNGETKKVIVRVKDEDGNYMKGLTVNAVMENTFFATIDSSGVTDSNGTANLNAEGILPGLTNVKFTVSGTTFEKTIEVKVETEPVRTKRPTAIVGGTTISEGVPKVNNVTVEKGSTLTLSTATAGAKIYYMTGESAPCSNCVLEKEYTGPIVLNENVKITAIAYKAGLEYSEDLVINITVTQKADYTIAYNLNGGSIYGLTGTIYESYNKGTTINLLDAPSRAGYKFLYWDSSEYKAGSSYVVNGNRTFNAIWKLIDNNTGGKDTGKDDTGKGSDTDPKTPGKDDTTPKNPTDNPVPGEDTTNNQGISTPLLITLIVCGIGVLTFIFILIGKRRKKEDE